MKTRYHITVLAVATLTAFASFTLAGGCSKIARQEASDTPSTAESKDSGIVELSDGVPSQHDLGNETVCTIVPDIQKDGTISMTLRIDHYGKLLAAPKVQARSGQKVTLEIGDIRFGLTPQVKR